MNLVKLIPYACLGIILLLVSTGLTAQIIVRSYGTDCASDPQAFSATCNGNCSSFSWTISGTHTEPGAGYTSSSIGGFSWTSSGVQSVSVSFIQDGNSISDTYLVTISPSVVPQVTIVPAGSIIYGTSATFSLSTNINGGNSPTYQWYLNDLAQTGETGTQYQKSNLGDNDRVFLRMYSSATCADPSYDDSDVITVVSTVSPPDVPTASNNTCGPIVLTRGAPPAGITWFWVGTNPNATSSLSDETYIVNEAINETYYLRAMINNVWSEAVGVKVTTNPVDLILSSYESPLAQATHSITLSPGFTVPAGKQFTARITITSECNDIYNWTENIGFDENGEPVTRTKSYLDGLASLLQSQSIDFMSGKVWASQPLYDRFNAASASTMPAPILESDFIYKNAFVTGAQPGEPYNANDFDKPETTFNAPGELYNPNPIGKADGTLGWYYSNSNSMESMAPTTDYPYSRTYTPEGPNPTVSTTAAPGNQYKMGSGHEVSGEKLLIVPGDLTHYVSLRSHFPEASILPINGYKYISTDPDGKNAVSFVDAEGKTIASATMVGSVYDNWSYTYYNDLGQIIASVAPNGVTASTAYPSFVTLYKYDHLGRQIEVTSTDEGTSKFVYSIDGTIRFSQNQEQYNAIPKRFSYTNYDYLGRLIESGEYISDGTDPYIFESHATVSPGTFSILNIIEYTGFTGVSRKVLAQEDRCIDYTFVEYDLLASDFIGGPASSQNNLSGQISKTENAISKTWYSYDEFEQLIWTKQNIAGLGDRTIEYSYDYFGNVTEVAYQKSSSTDRFHHHYVYDVNQRLSEVYTSKDGVTKTLHAKYFYYLHGPLKRVELGTNLQGIDYVYNIDGSLKLINHADPNLDPGLDGISGAHSNFMKDVFGEALDYNTNDYTGAGYNEGTLTLGTYPDQFGGAVKAIRWHSPTDSHVPRTYAFTYDNLNQMDNANWGNMTGTAGAYGFTLSGTQAYKEDIGGYDKNGNIQSLVRKGKTGNDLANFNYAYEPNTNKLASVAHNGASLLDYEYNSIGQMIEQTEGTNTMKVGYNVFGLVKEVRDGDDQLRESFVYDDRGNRVLRINYTDGTPSTNTFYVYDASGNVLAIYEQALPGGTPQLAEVPVYGAGRVAVHKPAVSTYFYEISDHLGNVRGVIGNPETLVYTATLEDNGQPEVTNPRVQEMANYKNLSATQAQDVYMNHTAPSGYMPVPEYSAYLSWVDGVGGIEPEEKSVGPAIGLKVEPGDKLDLETWAKYEKKTGTYSRPGITGAIATILGSSFVGTASGLDVLANAIQVFQNGMTSAVGAALGNGNDASTLPYAYLYYILYDRNFAFVTAGWSRVTTAGGHDPGDGSFSSHEKLTIPTITITEPGYIYVFVANESEDTRVWFDDIKVTHQRSTVVAGKDYYPFGLTMEGREISREDYRYGYQGQYSEEDKETGWNSFELRMYDARIGRWISPDPYGEFYSPYLAMGNSPANTTDPDGGSTGPLFNVIAKFKYATAIFEIGDLAFAFSLAKTGVTILNSVTVTSSAVTGFAQDFFPRILNGARNLGNNIKRAFVNSAGFANAAGNMMTYGIWSRMDASTQTDPVAFSRMQEGGDVFGAVAPVIMSNGLLPGPGAGRVFATPNGGRIPVTTPIVVPTDKIAVHGQLNAGTQLNSKTLWKGKGKERIDVENPNPTQRPGQIHYQDNVGNKYIYDHTTGTFRNAPKSVNELLADASVKAAIEKGLRYLGL